MKKQGGVALFAGTTEGRELTELFAGSEVPFDVFVATSYGASLLPDAPNVRIHTGRLDEKEMQKVLRVYRPILIVDATHPYASAVTETIREACAALSLSYLRVRRRAATELRASGGAVHTRPCAVVSNMSGAVSFLAKKEGRILFTTGSRDIREVREIPDASERVYARVLPAAASLSACAEAGLSASHIIAMQGPFSRELNAALLRQFDIRWMVTKDSGEEGGCPEKLLAAEDTGTGVVLIGRPKEAEGAVSLAEAVRQIRETFPFCVHSEKKNDILSDRENGASPQMLLLVGMGPGNLGCLTDEAKQAVYSADVLIGARRVLAEADMLLQAESCADRGKGSENLPVSYSAYAPDDVLSYLVQHPEFKKAALLYSGDISFYSGAKRLREKAGGRFAIQCYPGISSVSYFLGKIGVAREACGIVSLHGRSQCLIPRIAASRFVLVLAGSETDVSDAAAELVAYGMDTVRITVGERLSYPDERIFTGTPGQMQTQRHDPLALLLFENPEAREVPAGYGLPDEDFIRGKVPMTKRDVRAAILDRLRLTHDSVVWDVGAGTGSVSVEAALHVPDGEVWAVEKMEEACALIAENRKKFHCGNVKIVPGSAPEALDPLPAPDAVFVGGSGGAIREICACAFRKNPACRVVVTAVTAETVCAIYTFRGAGQNYAVSCTELHAVREEKAGSYHIKRAENPVLIAEITERRGCEQDTRQISGDGTEERERQDNCDLRASSLS